MARKGKIQTQAVGHTQGMRFGRPVAKIVMWRAVQREGLESKIIYGVVKTTQGASAEISESPENENLMLLLIG